MKGKSHKTLIRKVSFEKDLIFVEVDSTVISEIEYLNILPDMDIDESSFLKGSFVNGHYKNDKS